MCIKKFFLLLVIFFPVSLFADSHISLGGGGQAVFPLKGGFITAPVITDQNDPLLESDNGFGYGYYFKLALGVVELGYFETNLTWKKITLSSGQEISTSDLPHLKLHNFTIAGKIPVLDGTIQMWFPVGYGFSIIRGYSGDRKKNFYGDDLFAGIEFGVKINKNTRIEFGARYNYFILPKPDNSMKEKGEKKQIPSSSNASKDIYSRFQSLIVNIGITHNF